MLAPGPKPSISDLGPLKFLFQGPGPSTFFTDSSLRTFGLPHVGSKFQTWKILGPFTLGSKFETLSALQTGTILEFCSFVKTVCLYFEYQIQIPK